MGDQRHAPAALRDLVTTVQKAGWAPGPVWTGVENLAPHFVCKTYEGISEYIMLRCTILGVLVCKVTVKSILEQAIKDQRGSRGIALYFNP